MGDSPDRQKEAAPPKVAVEPVIAGKCQHGIRARLFPNLESGRLKYVGKFDCEWCREVHKPLVRGVSSDD